MAASLAEVYCFLKDCFIICDSMLKNDIQEKNSLRPTAAILHPIPRPLCLGLGARLGQLVSGCGDHSGMPPGVTGEELVHAF